LQLSLLGPRRQRLGDPFEPERRLHLDLRAGRPGRPRALRERLPRQATGILTQDFPFAPHFDVAERTDSTSARRASGWSAPAPCADATKRGPSSFSSSHALTRCSLL